MSGLLTPSGGRHTRVAAVDLGSNACRLLIAEADGCGGFDVLEPWSRIVRLAEGAAPGRPLGEQAVERALGALEVCAERLARWRPYRLRAVATAVCRTAADGPEFVVAVRRRTGVELEIISSAEEARLSVESCRDLIDSSSEVTLVIDIGGGSTELSWVDRAGCIAAWRSLPVGVVGLAEQRPEPDADKAAWRRELQAQAAIALVDAEPIPPELRAAFSSGRGRIIGASGALAGLTRMALETDEVDGLDIDTTALSRAGDALERLSLAERGAHPAVGPGRADLMLPGAAILAAVQGAWAAPMLRVADRGLREGIVRDLLARSHVEHAA